MVLLVFVLFGAGAVFFGHRAATNDRGLVIDRLIELGPYGADVFYSTLCTISAIFFLVGVGSAVQRVLRPMRIGFTTDGLIVPYGQISSREICIRYAEINAIKKYRQHSNDYIKVHHSAGEYTILGFDLASATEVQAVFAKITEMCPHLK